LRYHRATRYESGAVVIMIMRSAPHCCANHYDTGLVATLTAPPHDERLGERCLG
jgi:hypothetical protein